MIKRISVLLLAGALLQGCSVLGVKPGDKPVVAKVENYEVAGVSVDMADAISADLVDLLRTYYPPEKHQFVFRPGEGVLGKDLADRLRTAGYGVLGQPAFGRSELFYIADQLPRQMYRVSLRIEDWRLDRLYRFDAGQWKGFGSTSNQQAKAVLVKPVVKPEGPEVKAKVSGPVPQNKTGGAAKGDGVVSKGAVSAVVKVVPKKPVKPKELRTAYFVQLMAGANHENLQYNKSLLEADGFSVAIMPLQSKPISALRVGAWSEKADAEVVKARLLPVYRDAFIWEALL